MNNSMFKLKIKINADSMINLSVLLFIFLYFLPITITLPGIIRKPLLIFGFAIFAFSVFSKYQHYFLMWLIASLYAVVFYMCSWTAYLSFASYMFPAFISIEFFVLALMVLDGRFALSKSVINILIIVTLITAITSIVGLQKYPLAIRTLGQGATDENAPLQLIFRQNNIAGWGLIFAMAFMEGPLLYAYKKKKNWKLLIPFIVDGICVFLSQVAFAIILAIVEVFLILINGQSRKLIFRIIPIFVLAIIAWFQRGEILKYLMKWASEHGLTVFQLRAQNLYDLLLFKDTSGDAGARFELYSKSFSSMLKHPFGILLFSDGEKMDLLGYHSDFFDMLGSTGIIGVFAIIVVIRCLVSRNRRISDAYERRFMIIMSGLFGVMFFINPILSNPHIWLVTLLMAASLIGNNMIEAV